MPTWIRVRDDVTGAEYDIEESSLRGGLTPVPDYPVLTGEGVQPRAAKPLVAKDGAPAASAADRDEEPPASPADQTEESKP